MRMHRSIDIAKQLVGKNSRYYASDEIFPWANNIRGGKPVPEEEYTIQGLALPREVLEKVYYQNAVKWFPGLDKEY